MDAANRLGPAAETADVSLVYTCGSCALQAPAKSNFPPLMRFFLGISVFFLCVDSADWAPKFTHGGDLV